MYERWYPTIRYCKYICKWLELGRSSHNRLSCPTGSRNQYTICQSSTMSEHSFEIYWDSSCPIYWGIFHASTSIFEHLISSLPWPRHRRKEEGCRAPGAFRCDLCWEIDVKKRTVSTHGCWGGWKGLSSPRKQNAPPRQICWSCFADPRYIVTVAPRRLTSPKNSVGFHVSSCFHGLLYLCAAMRTDFLRRREEVRRVHPQENGWLETDPESFLFNGK